LGNGGTGAVFDDGFEGGKEGRKEEFSNPAFTGGQWRQRDDQDIRGAQGKKKGYCAMAAGLGRKEGKTAVLPTQKKKKK